MAAHHTSEFGTWQTVHQPASVPLRPYVHGYMGSSSQLRVAVRERHLPSLEVPIVLNFGAPHHRRERAGSGEWTAHEKSWVVGLHRTPQLASAAGERHFMVVRFTPVGAHLCLGVPMHLVADRAIALEDISPVLARDLSSRVRSAGTWAERFRAAESVIAARIADAGEENPVDHAWRRLTATGGRVSLRALASDLGCSHRTLIARFRMVTGLPPKTIARLMRFTRAVRSLDRLSGTRADAAVNPPFIETSDPAPRFVDVRWADLATDCGYVDQSHLIREFKEFAGTTPEAFVRQVSYQL
jgi:AraC-like DNA-binding protein